QTLLGPALRIPGHAQEKFYGEFHGLEIAHIGNPDFGGVILIGEVHLFPDLGDGHSVDPAVGAGATHIIEVIIDTGTAGTLALFDGGQTADIAPVVVAPEKNHIVRYTHAALVKTLYFLVERPHLRHLGYFILAENICQYAALITHNF